MFVSMVLYPFHGSEAGKKRLSERKEALLTRAVVTLQRIVAFGVAVHGDSHFSLEAGEIVGVLELLDLDLGDRKFPFPFFLTSVGANSAPSMMVGSRAAPKSLLSAISFSKSRRISCLDGGTRKDLSSVRLWSLTTQRRV
jgi:hypothetical protein